MNILMVGYNASLLKSIKDCEIEKYNIVVLEEKDLYYGKKLFEKKSPHLKDVILGEYQRSDECLRVLKDYINSTATEFDAIIAGLEYGAIAANKMAKEFGLPFSNVKDVDVFGNKLKFREHCQNYGIPQPKFTRVDSSQDITDFFREEKIVLKPANRQASLGVIKIDDREDIVSSWDEVLKVDEGVQIASREFDQEYLVEECIIGAEVSTEVFVSTGKVEFMNVTDKIITDGKYSVELGHTVPTSLTQEDVDTLNHNVAKLVDSLDFDNGVLHIEWIVSKNGPKIIECAARPPGDQIFNLIKLAYGFDPYEAYMCIMAGKEFEFPLTNYKSAAIRFFNSEEGVVKSIEGLESLKNSPQVIDWGLKISTGDYIQKFESSWNRIGHMTIKGDSKDNAKDIANKILNQIKIEIASR